MELGALICRPQNPNCSSCPIAKDCNALVTNRVKELPFKSKKEPTPHYTIGVAIIRKDEKILIGKRKDDGFLGGLWEFPGGKKKAGETIAQTIKREVKEETNVTIKIGDCVTIVKHAYSHFKITMHAYLADLIEGEPNLYQPMSYDATVNGFDLFRFRKQNGDFKDAGYLFDII